MEDISETLEAVGIGNQPFRRGALFRIQKFAEFNKKSRTYGTPEISQIC